jgi:carbon monoxide dehydrogenase subunit G
MTTIETNHQEVNGSTQEVFEFLSDFNNFEHLLPQDRVENWSSTADACSFRIKGMADIGMEIEDKTPHSAINIKSKGKVPFDFKLNVVLKETEQANQSVVYMVFSGDINPFMKMMVEKPLRNFFNMLVAKLAEIRSAT